MRDFYRAYVEHSEVLAEAMSIGWTQNVVILEAELTLQDKLWYIRAVRQSGWFKLKLAERIGSSAHREIALDLTAEVCYTKKNSVTECVNDDKDPLCVPRPYLENFSKSLQNQRFQAPQPLLLHHYYTTFVKSLK